jgi:transcription initiation factor TFIIIB Brf1 subunit/transcription initiation factor TFIIB
MSHELENLWSILESEKAEKQNLIKIKKQECCDKKYLMELNGYCVCVNCGVISSNIVFDDDLFGFENGVNNIYLRKFDNHLFPVSSTSSMINGNSKMSKIQSWQSMPYNEKVLWEVSKDLKSRVGSILSNRIINDTLSLYKDFYETSGIFRGDIKKGFVAVCLYISCSKNFANITPKDLSKIFELDLSVIYKCIQKYSEIMKISTNCNKKSSEYVESFINKIGLNYKIRKTAVKIINYLQDYQLLDSYMPQNVCLAVIFFICEEMSTPLDMSLITKEFSISSPTLKKILSYLEKNKIKIFNALKKK